MKFLVSKNLHSNPNFTLLIGFYSVMLFMYFIGDMFYLFNFFGSNVAEVLSTLNGNEEEYIEPLSLLSLLEYIHISLFSSLLSLFTTLAIILRLNLKQRHKRLIIITSMLGLFLSFISLFTTYFINDIFVYTFIFMTILWHLVGVYASSLILIRLGIK